MMNNGENITPESAFQGIEISKFQESIDRFDTACDVYANSFFIYKAKSTPANSDHVNNSGALLARSFRESVEYIIDDEGATEDKATQILSLMNGGREQRLKLLNTEIKCDHPDDASEELAFIKEQLAEALQEGFPKSKISEKITYNFISFQGKDFTHFMYHFDINREQSKSYRIRSVAKDLGYNAVRMVEIAGGVVAGLAVYKIINR